MSFSFARAAAGAFLFALAVSSCTCGTSLGAVDAGPEDAGPVIITCGSPTDDPCPVDVPECSFGVCKRPCAANDGCIDPNTFCNATTGYCEFGCRDSSTCTGGTVCSGGSCIESQGCATKCDCGVGQVCISGACQDPPASCNSADDCPKAPGDQCDDFACNGFTHLCFDPDPEPCTEDTDCNGRPGCAQGCTCTGNQACVPSVDCTEANETTTCGGGNYCDGNGTCQTLPGCTQESDCASLGLTCNVGQGQCVRARACASSSECTTPPTTYCNLATGFCAQPLCTNGGVTCNANQTCAADGRCVTGGGGACTNDTQCGAGQICEVVGSSGQCVVGCRNNSDCENGQQCDGTNTCVVGGGLKQFGEACTDDAECQVGLICGTATGTCAEPCDTPGTQCNGGTACCPLSGAGCCNQVFIFGFCGDC
jgi:hypothetical protein